MKTILLALVLCFGALFTSAKAATYVDDNGQAWNLTVTGQDALGYPIFSSTPVLAAPAAYNYASYGYGSYAVPSFAVVRNRLVTFNPFFTGYAGYGFSPFFTGYNSFFFNPFFSNRIAFRAGFVTARGVQRFTNHPVAFHFFHPFSHRNF
jgi:hypothetical protein